MTLGYEHSGRAPITGLALATLSGVVAAAALGAAYSYGDVYIPIIYFNVLLTALFGLGIGWAVSWGGQIGHLRSRILPAAIGLFCGLVGIYIAWAADALARLGVPPNGDPAVVLRPDFLKTYIAYFYENGFWAIGHGVGGNNNNNGQQMVSGIFLAAVWLTEAAIILGFAAGFPWIRFGRLVYCEGCERWAKHAKGVRRLSLGAPDLALAQLAAGDLKPLADWPQANPSDRAYLRVNLDSCDGCSKTNYLSIDRVTTVLDKKGKPKQDVKPLVTRIAVSADDAARLRAAV